MVVPSSCPRLIFSHLFSQLIQAIPQGLIAPISTTVATITLRNELGTSLPLNLDKFTRTDIFSALTRDPHSEAADTSSSSETAWIGVFYRGRFSAKLHLTSTTQGTDPSAVTGGPRTTTTTITFLICGNDMSPLSDTGTKKPSFRASQKFISPKGASPVRVLPLTCAVDIPIEPVNFSLIATFDSNYPLSRKYTRRAMLGYSAWGTFKADLDAELGSWKAWTGPKEQGRKDHSAAATMTMTTDTGVADAPPTMTMTTGMTTTVDVPPVRRLLSPARRVPLLKSRFEIQTSSDQTSLATKGPLTEAVHNSRLNIVTGTAPEGAQLAKKTPPASAMRTKIPIAVRRLHRDVVPVSQGIGNGNGNGSALGALEEVCIQIQIQALIVRRPRR